MTTSFISEHSAEYVLVPKLIGILRRRFAKVIPLYFLITREGSLISRACAPSYPVRILNVFARRPKVGAPYSPWIEVKFNSILFTVAELSARYGMATMAGVPLVSSLMDLSLDSQCAWFALSGAPYLEVYYDLLLDGTIDSQSHQSAAVKGPLSEDELIEISVNQCREIRWSDAIDSLRILRHIPGGVFGGGYHPFSLLLVEQEA